MYYKHKGIRKSKYKQIYILINNNSAVIFSNPYHIFEL